MNAAALQSDPDGRAAYAAGRSVTAPEFKTVQLLSSVCAKETLDLLKSRGERTDLAVIRDENGQLILWRDEDAGRLLDALSITEDEPDYFTEAWRAFHETGSVADLDALAAAWLESAEEHEFEVEEMPYD